MKTSPTIQKLLEFIVRAIADEPDRVTVEVEETDDLVSANVTAASPDIGRIIGKAGKMINAIRSIAKVCAMRANKKLVLQVG